MIQQLAPTSAFSTLHTRAAHIHTMSPLDPQPASRSDAVSYEFLPLSRMFLPSSLPASLGRTSAGSREGKHTFHQPFLPFHSTIMRQNRDCLPFQQPSFGHVTSPPEGGTLVPLSLYLSTYFSAWYTAENNDSDK